MDSGRPGGGGDEGGSSRHLVLGRLRPDGDAAAAQARLDVAGSAFLRQAPERERHFVRFHAQGYQDHLARNYRGVMLLLLTAAGLVRRVPRAGARTGAAERVRHADLEYLRDLGLIDGGEPPRIANPIYAEVVPRELGYVLQSSLDVQTAWYVDAGGRLNLTKLLTAFRTFFGEHSEHWLGRFSEYPEAGLAEVAAAEAEAHDGMADRPVPSVVDGEAAEQRLGPLEQLL